MSFEARYHGRCGTCDEHVAPGDRVRYDDNDTLIHEDCDAAPPLPDKPVATCSTCWLTKPCGCDD